MGNTKSKPKETAQKASVLIHKCCVDVHAEIFGFLEANDQAKLRRASKYFCTVFNHAFQRGYVAAAIHEGYVEKLDAMHEDGEDGHPLLRVAPVDPKALFWEDSKEIDRSRIASLVKYFAGRSKEKTLFVNVRLVLGNGKTELAQGFLRESSFKAVHLFGTETVENIRDSFLCDAEVQTFTMTTPCPKLCHVGNNWFFHCENLTHFDISGCSALNRVGNFWLFNCLALESASFKGCQLKHVGSSWMNGCTSLASVDLGDLVALEEVGDCWLNSCTSLLSVDFSPCRDLRTVGSCWCSQCRALKTIDLRGCNALEEINGGFLEDTDSIQRILVSKDHKLPANFTQQFGGKFVVVDDQ